MASTILNVLDFGARPNLDPKAKEFNDPECPNEWSKALEANRESIQKAIDSILVWAKVGGPGDQSLADLDPSSEVRIGTVVRFPAGIYHISGKLSIPYRQCFSLVGDGGLGGTVIVQHLEDEPIIEFTEEDTWGWTIENLWFTWNEPQTCDDDHSVAIHFGGGQPRSRGFYHGAIKSCQFENAYRGVSITPLAYKFCVDEGVAVHAVEELDNKSTSAISGQFDSHPASVTPPFTQPASVTVDRPGHRWRIDETENPENRYFVVWKEKDALNVYESAKLPVWGTHIDHCTFAGCRGSAIYLVGNCGMPSNSISNTMIANREGRENKETQLVLSAQSGMSLTSLDLEASSTTVIYADSSVITINGLHLEHLKVPINHPGRILYLADTNYEIHGLSCSFDIDPARSLNLIEGGYGANIVVTGVAVNRTSESPRYPIYLFAGQEKDPYGRKTSFRLVGQVKHDPKKKLELYDKGNQNMVERVTVDPIKVRANLSFPSIPAGATKAHRVPVTGARPGDIVSLGPPDTLPAGLIAFGLVRQRDELVTEHYDVEVRILNTTSEIIPPFEEIWTITTGGGPQFE